MTQDNLNNLPEKTINGVGWSAVAQVGRQGVQFVISIVLARLLTPNDFGLVGMILVFTGFVALFGEFGFSAALIQKEEISETYFGSIFWLNVALGLLLACLTLLASPLISIFYEQPALTPLIQALALNFVVVSLGLVHKAILERALNFRHLAIAELSGVTIGGVVAITLALLGYGVWSLVWQLLLTSVVTTIVLWWVASWRPERAFNIESVKDLLSFSSNLFGFNAFNYWARNADNLLIGKYIGTAGLGIYTRAYSTMLLPLSQITNVLNRVMFPAFSRLQHDKVRIKRIYLKSLAMIALVTFPMMMGLFVTSENFVLALFGSAWKDVIPVLRILCLIGMVQSLVSTVGWIYQSQGRTDWLFRWGLLAGSLAIISFIVGVSIGTVTAVAWAYAILNMVLFYWNFSIPGKLIDLSVSEVIRAILPILGSAALMAFSVTVLGLYLPSYWPHWLLLASQVIVGALIYWLVINFFQMPAYLEIKSLLLPQLQKLGKVRSFIH